jgi:hypothetical protein
MVGWLSVMATQVGEKKAFLMIDRARAQFPVEKAPVVAGLWLNSMRRMELYDEDIEWIRRIV